MLFPVWCRHKKCYSMWVITKVIWKLGNYMQLGYKFSKHYSLASFLAFESLEWKEGNPRYRRQWLKWSSVSLVGKRLVFFFFLSLHKHLKLKQVWTIQLRCDNRKEWEAREMHLSKQEGWLGLQLINPLDTWDVILDKRQSRHCWKVAWHSDATIVKLLCYHKAIRLGQNFFPEHFQSIFIIRKEWKQYQA